MKNWIGYLINKLRDWLHDRRDRRDRRRAEELHKHAASFKDVIRQADTKIAARAIGTYMSESQKHGRPKKIDALTKVSGRLARTRRGAKQ